MAGPPGPPSRFVADWLASRTGRPGRALDLACGTGRHALAMARHGWRVDAVDVSAAALARARQAAAAEPLPRAADVRWIEADLDDWPIPAAAYGLMVVAGFLDRRLVPGLVDGLRPGGWLLYEQHFIAGRPVAGPSSDRFRVARGELPTLFAELETHAYREDFEPAPHGLPLALARLVARRPPDGPGSGEPRPQATAPP